MMRALSVMQPWASLIVGGPLSPGVKRTENRGKMVASAARKLVGQRIAIHASKKLDEEGIHSLRSGVFNLRREEVPYNPISAFPRGAVIGVATLDRVFDGYDVLTDDERRFFTGDFGLSFSDQRWFEPVPCKGALGFWTMPADVEAKVRAQLTPTERCGDPCVWKGCARRKGHEGGHCTYDIDDAIEKSSIGAGLRDIAERGIEAHTADLERELDELPVEFGGNKR